MERYEQYGWTLKQSPKELGIGTGWFAEIDTVLVDQRQHHCVQIRTVQTIWGPVKHAAIRNHTCTDIPWATKQKIKNQIFGLEATAIEVFPAVSELVDEANMYHIWVLPESLKLPFSIHPGFKGVR